VRTVEFVEYNLSLSTGEDIRVSELDPESIPSLTDPVVVRLADAVLSRCTRAPRSAVEDAKSGLPESLEAHLGSPPAGCLLRVSVPVCAELKFCVISDPVRCSTRHRTKRGPGFPMCWTFSVPEGGTGPQRSQAQDLADSIVSAWRDGRHVVIADG
jgi:hypothetical protein